MRLALMPPALHSTVLAVRVVKNSGGHKPGIARYGIDPDLHPEGHATPPGRHGSQQSVLNAQRCPLLSH